MKKRIETLLTVILMALFLSAFPAHALTISPPLYDLGVAPGQSVTESLKVFNETQETNTWYFETQNFTSQGEDGEPSFAGEGNTEDLASWIALPTQPITLAPGETQTVNFTINVPKDADAGGHYAAVFLTSTPPNTNGGAVGVSSRIGALILLRVAGDIIEAGSLQQFGFSSGSGVYASLPVDFTVLFQNSGNVHVKPFGSITVHDASGNVAASILVNQAEQPDGTIAPVGNVLPSSTREFDEMWGTSSSSTQGFWSSISYEWNNFAFGKYTAALHLSYGTEGETIDSSLSFWIFPWQLILVILIGLALLVLLIVFGVRRYNRWIIGRAAGK
jgi:hypothetical protein